MIKNKLKSIIAGGAAALLVIGPAAAFARSDNGNSNAGNKVTICHATGSQTNPFVVITPNANGVVSGHIGHQDSRDIIPPFDYNSHGTQASFAGQNWDANGQAIFHNGCRPVSEGGPTKDCDNDFDNSPASECTTGNPTADCDGDFDSSSASECATGNPTTDCDGDFDSSSASECAQGGGRGGQVLGSTTAVGGAAQVAAPQGGVNAGAGGANAFSLSTLQRVW